MDWFEILYYINKYSFSGIDGFNSAYEASQKLNAAKDDSRVEVIMDYLARNNMMDDAHINMMLDAMSDENRSKIDSLVDEIYKDIAAVGNFGDEKYGVALAKIIATNGSCLREEDEEESETSSSYEKHFLGEKTVQKFINDVNELKKNTEHDLVSLVKFVYENNLNQVSYKNIYGDDADVCNDLQIIVPVIEGILDVESYMDDIECDFYDVILEDYSSDEAFIEAIGNIVNDFITFDSGKFDADALLNEIKTIRKNYPDEDLIAYQSVEKMLESKKVLSDNSKYVAGLFTSNKYGDYNVTLAIRHYKAYCDNDTITGKNIIDSDDVADKVKEGINNVLKFILTGYMNTINEISQKILVYDKMIATPFYINNKIKMDIIEVVNLWKNFISSNAYKYLGKSIDDEVIKKCSDLIAKNKYTIDVAGKPQPVFKKEAENIMNLIRDVNIVKPEGRYSSVLDYITTRFAKIDTPIYTQINVMSVVVQYLKDFFMIEFKNKIDFGAGEKMNMLFDAVCNLVYYKDKHIHESYVYEGLFFGSYAVMEAKDKLDYFNKLWSYIEDFFGKKKEDINVVKYVKDEADLDIPDAKDETVDSSVNTGNSENALLTQDQINNLNKDADELKTTVSSLDGQAGN